jgi:hypothetical protein
MVLWEEVLLVKKKLWRMEGENALCERNASYL